MIDSIPDWVEWTLMTLGVFAAVWAVLFAVSSLLTLAGNIFGAREDRKIRVRRLLQLDAWDEGFKAGADWEWHETNTAKGMEKPGNPYEYAGCDRDRRELNMKGWP